MDESVYMINLKKAFEKPRNKRAKRAMKIVREFIAKHTKTPLENVRLSNHLNSVVWTRGIQKPPRRIKVKTVRSDGKSYVYHIDEKIELPKEKKEEKKGEKPKEAKDEKKETAEKAEVKKEEAKKEAKKEDKPTAKQHRKLSDKEKKSVVSKRQEDI